LGLNFVKDGGVWHCVRCGAGGRGLGEFLSRNNVSSALYDLRRSPEDFKKLKHGLMEKITVPYHPPVLGFDQLPPMRRLREDDFTDPTIYGDSMIRKHISWDEAQRAALCAGTGRKHSPYVIFPFFETIEDTEPCYWQGRDATGKAYLRKLNPSNEECPQGKNHWLYGFEYAERGCEVYLVEGTLDRISLQTWLAKNRGDGHVALAIQGTILSFPSDTIHPLNTQYGKMASLHPSKVHVVFDPDAWKKAQELSQVLQMCGLEAEAVRLFFGDPNESCGSGGFESQISDRTSAFKQALLSAPFTGASTSRPSQPSRRP